MGYKFQTWANYLFCVLASLTLLGWFPADLVISLSWLLIISNSFLIGVYSLAAIAISVWGIDDFKENDSLKHLIQIKDVFSNKKFYSQIFFAGLLCVLSYLLNMKIGGFMLLFNIYAIVGILFYYFVTKTLEILKDYK